MVPIPGQRDDQRQLSQLRGLKTHRAEAEPTPRAIDPRADVPDQHQNQQHGCERQQRHSDLPQQPIVHHRRRAAQGQAKPAPDQLHDQVARSALPDARAVEHHHPKRQQGGNAEHEHWDGYSHGRWLSDFKAPRSHSPHRRARSRHIHRIGGNLLDGPARV